MSELGQEIAAEEAEAEREAEELAVEGLATVSDASDAREEPEAAGVSREEVKRNMAANMREKAKRLKG